VGHTARSGKRNEKDFWCVAKEIGTLFFEVTEVGFAVNGRGTYNE